MITLLVIVFIAVFGFLGWRIIMNATSAKSKPDEAYICPLCDEQHCVCDPKKDT